MKKSMSFLVVFALVALTVTCSGRPPFVMPDPGLVGGLTTGVISKMSTIKVLFSEAIGSGERIEEEPVMSFSPAIKGKARWLDEYSLEFTPEKNLTPGQFYNATVNLASLGKSGSDASYFNFTFAVKKPSYTITFDAIACGTGGNGDLCSIGGRIRTEDAEDSSMVEKILSFGPSSRGTTVSWSHSDGSPEHGFVINGIPKRKSGYAFTVSWRGNAIDSRTSGSRNFDIPAAGRFAVAEIRPVSGEEEHVAVSFTDKLDDTQDFRGLIRVAGYEDLRFVPAGNAVKIYSPAKRYAEELAVYVERAVRSASGKELELPASEVVAVEYQKPAVRFAGTGVILPASQGLTVPIETMNLNAIMVEAIRIYGDNMTQFLQVNSLDTDKELIRTGKVVWTKVVQLGWSANQANTWVRHGLDLTQLVANNPDGMFQLRITFRKPHVQYQCTASLSEEDEAAAREIEFPVIEGRVGGDTDESSYWDYYESYDDRYYAWYERRFDPCHPAYYEKYSDHDVTVKRNVLVSDIGLIAKLDVGKKLHVFACDLKNTSPLAGVSIDVLDYTKRKIAAGKSDKQGVLALQCDDVPFFLVAQYGKQYGYLRLDEGSALATSHFDVGGDLLAGGIKGLVYGERGVWRPGDTVYLTFVLFDPDKTIPPKHPIQVEMTNPRGQVEYRETKTDSLNGFYPIQIRTNPDALTGDWIVRVRLGGAAFAKTVKIENVMPNRLKIDLKLQGKPYVTEGDLRGTLQAQWLHGAKAPGLQADLAVSFFAVPTIFAKYGDYVFDDPTRDSVPQRQEVFAGVLDGSGSASFSKPLHLTGNVSGKLRAGFVARVFESGGVFSTEQTALDCYPYPRYVGIKLPKGDETRGMLLTDTNHKVDIIVVDPEGNPVQSAKLTAEIFEIKWRWWWEKQPESLAEYAESRSVTKLRTDTVNVANGKGEWVFNVKYPEWGRYLVRVTDQSGRHSAGKVVYIDWPGWAGRGQKDNPGGSSVLTLSTDKTRYAVGDKVKVSFPSNKDGAALVCVEAGGAILRKEWIAPKQGTTSYEFLAAPSMAPNVYVHVTFLQPHLQTANDLPIRVYGVVPVSVENPETHLAPVITAAESYAPGSEFSVTVSESGGKPMSYTLAIVDEGLLGLTRFTTPDPWNTFYAKEASLLKNWDLYGWVAGAYAGKLSTLLSIGGGDDLQLQGGRKADRFPPLVRFFGPVTIGKGERKTHGFTLPNYVGAVRCMVVAGFGGAYGTAEKSVYVKSDLMVLGTLPRVLSPDERVQFPVTVFAYDPAIKSVKVAVTLSGPVSIQGQSEQTVRFDAPGDTLALFSLVVAKQLGVAKLAVKATANTGKTATSEIELDVRSLGTPVNKVLSKLVDKAGEWEEKLSLPGAAGTNAVTLEISNLPPLDIEKRLRFLIQYPHGCIEQTTSSVFPQVSLDLVAELSRERKSEIEKNVKAGIERLLLFQTAGGGFAYWPGETEPSDWGSSYAGHFLVEAKKRGYAIPSGLIENWVAYQKKRANEHDSDDEHERMQQAYRLYTLALSGNPEIGAMNRLREKKSNTPAVVWRLASAYQLSGQRDAALRLVANVGTDVKEYDELSGTFGSDLRDKAMILEALVLLDKLPLADPLIKEISQRLSGDEWISTQSTAYALIALAPYATKVSKDMPLIVSYSVDGGKGARVQSRGKMILERIPVGNATACTLKVTNEGESKIYPRLILRGTPLLENESHAANGVRLDLRYTDNGGTIIDPSEAAQGTDIVIEATITNLLSYGLPNLVLDAKLPAGWEIMNERIGADSDTGEGQKPGTYDYADIRDDRVYLYFGLGDRKTDSYNAVKTFVLRVNNTYAGRFYLPAMSVYAMYDESIQAVVPGKWID